MEDKATSSPCILWIANKWIELGARKIFMKFDRRLYVGPLRSGTLWSVSYVVVLSAVEKLWIIMSSMTLRKVKPVWLFVRRRIIYSRRNLCFAKLIRIYIELNFIAESAAIMRSYRLEYQFLRWFNAHNICLSANRSNLNSINSSICVEVMERASMCSKPFNLF